MQDDELFRQNACEVLVHTIGTTEVAFYKLYLTSLRIVRGDSRDIRADHVAAIMLKLAELRTKVRESWPSGWPKKNGA